MKHDYSTPNPVFFDFETQSPVELKKTGGRRYAESPDTRVLALSCLIDRHLIVWVPMVSKCPAINMPDRYKPLYDDFTVYVGGMLPKPICEAVEAGRVFVAHNMAHFDYFIWEHCVTGRGLGPLPAAWGDTLFLARMAGLPVGGLDQIAKRMLGEEKDSAKRIVMPLTRGWYENGECYYPTVLPGQVEPLVRYCCVDTLLLPLLWDEFDSLRVEADVIQAHQDINDRGIAVDLKLAAKISEVSAYAAMKAAKEIEELTGGVLHAERPQEVDKKKRKGNLRSTKQVHEWLESHGLRITDHTGKKLTLRKDEVDKHLANPLLMMDHSSPITLELTRKVNEIPKSVFRVLRLRSSATRITANKTDRMVDRVSSDNRIRDLLSYHKAHTGRWSSSGVQLHNLPRGKKGVDVGKLLKLYEDGHWSNDPAEAYEMINGTLTDDKVTVDDALSALVRPCFVAGEGNTLCIADYAAIECRGIAWLAGEAGLLLAYHEGKDIYCEMASIVFGRKITPDDKSERFLGKTIILGCGYGMGAEKFALTCMLSGIDLSKVGVTAEKCVELYRATYPAIAGSYSGMKPDGRAYRRGGIWDRLEVAAKNAVTEGGLHNVGKINYYYSNGNLHCVLPSGREMRYVNCRIEERVPGYVVALGLERRTKATLVYDGQYGTESILYGGKLAENVCQATTRDILAAAKVEINRLLFPVGSVHDELINESKHERAEQELIYMCQLMSSVPLPTWANGFPIGVEGYTSKRYVKEAPEGALKCEVLNGKVVKLSRVTGGRSIPIS